MKRGIFRFFAGKNMKIIIFIVFTLGAILNIYEYFTEGRRTIDIIAGVVYGILAAFHLEEIIVKQFIITKSEIWILGH